MSTSSSINNPVGKPLRLGKPLHRTGTNHLLFRVGADIPLKVLGAHVVDTSMTRRVGTVYDIFGPVENPFLSVKMNVPGTAGITDTDYLSASYFVLLELRRPGGKGQHEARKYSRFKSATPTKPKRS